MFKPKISLPKFKLPVKSLTTFKMKTALISLDILVLIDTKTINTTKQTKSITPPSLVDKQ